MATTASVALAADQNDLPSAGSALGASQRFDTELAVTEASGGEQLSWQFKYTRVLRSKHQFTAALPILDPDLDHKLSLRNGDLALGYAYTFNETISANPWIPSNAGSGIGLSLPTGDWRKGTGSGSYILGARLGNVVRVNEQLALTPSVEYFHSFSGQQGAPAIRSSGATVPLVYVRNKTNWINVSPIYLFDFERSQGAPGGSLLLGKLLLRHLAVSISYSRIPTFSEQASGDVTTEYISSWILGFHLPFSYR
jgi:hypothetical protein